MKALDIALIAGLVAQATVTALATIRILRPEWLARLATEKFLIRHSLWDECDGEPMNVWAEEFARRDYGWPNVATEGAPAEPTDEQIIAALHSVGIDTYPSKYGFDAVQVSATSVPGLKQFLSKLAAPAAIEQAGALPWTITRLHDMGTVHGPHGEFIGQTYFNTAKAFTDAHNASVEQAGAQPVAQAEPANVSELREALRQRNESAHREREKLMAHIAKLETALWKLGEPGEAALSNIRRAAPTPATDQDALDAKRYRFLRHADLDELARTYWPDSDVPEGKELDIIIDKVLANSAATPVTDQPKQEGQQ